MTLVIQLSSLESRRESGKSSVKIENLSTSSYILLFKKATSGLWLLYKTALAATTLFQHTLTEDSSQKLKKRSQQHSSDTTQLPAQYSHIHP